MKMSHFGAFFFAYIHIFLYIYGNKNYVIMSVLIKIVFFIYLIYKIITGLVTIAFINSKKLQDVIRYQYPDYLQRKENIQTLAYEEFIDTVFIIALILDKFGYITLF